MKTFRRLFFLTAWMSIAVCQEVRVPITADTSIAADSAETYENNGGALTIKMKGIENFIVLNFDPASLQGKEVISATAHLRGVDDKLMVRKVGVSTLATSWSEGTSSYVRAKSGESCFVSPSLADGSWWAGPESCFLDVLWGRGGTIHYQSLAKQEADLWYSIPVDGRLLEACASGLSSGLVFSDDNGQTKNAHGDAVPDSNFSNNFFHSREQAESAPYLTVTLRPVSAPAAVTPVVPSVIAWNAGADATTGGLEVRWPGPSSEAERSALIGYRLRLAVDGGASVPVARWMHPTIGPVGEVCRALLKRQPADTSVVVDVEIIGRGGVVIASGKAAGRTSAVAQAVAPLALPPALTLPAGAPTADARGLVWAMPDLAKANPITGVVLEEPDVTYIGDAKGTWSKANPVWSGATSTVSLSAIRGEWTAFQLVCQNNAPMVTWSITPSDLRGPGGSVIPANALRLSRLWYQKVGDAERDWYADPMVELAAGASFNVPDATNAVPGQTNQAVYIECFVPKDAAPGAYTGTVQVSTGDGKPLPVTVNLAVGTGLIPDQVTFVYSMNAYSSPAAGFGPVDSEAFLAAERSFYRMSHEHRTTLAVLGYSHNARFQEGIAWPLVGSGPDMKVSDWSAWDRRFGPYFDGSAYADMPRASVPLDHFYLPFMESWPTTMAAGYRWNASTWEDHWKVAGPIEEGFSPAYRDQWIAVMRDFHKHVQEKKWQTSFQIYLNNKYFYKQYTAKKKGPGEGTSFWLLDEPMHIDDFAALAYFGQLTRLALHGDRQSVAFRVDVSRPQWGRDSLDRVVDVNVTGGFSDYRPWLEDWRERHGQRVWTYGGAPSSRDSAYSIEMQAIDLYVRGVDGFVPWLTIGNDGNWTKFEDTCVFYSGKPRGLPGACASLRLKAYRRGQQDVEYIRLLAEQRGLLAADPNRRTVSAMLAGTLNAKRTLGTLDSQGAVTEKLSAVPLADFDRLRQAIVTQLAK